MPFSQLHQNRFYYYDVEHNIHVGPRIVGAHLDCEASVLANLNIYGDTSFVRKVNARLVGDISMFLSADCENIYGLISGLGGWVDGLISDINQVYGFVQFDPDTNAGRLWGTIDSRLRGSVDNIRGNLTNIWGTILCTGLVTNLSGDISQMKRLDVSFLSGNATGIICHRQTVSLSGNIDDAMLAVGLTDDDREDGIDIEDLTNLGWN
jgi:hypothetical protein